MNTKRTVIGKAFRFNVCFRPVTMTGNAGVVLLRDFIERLGLAQLLDEAVVVKERERGYPESENILSLCWNSILGGSCLRDLDVLRGDEGIAELLGVESVMAPTTAGEFLREFAIGDLNDLKRANRQAAQRVRAIQQSPTVTLDLDASLYEQSSSNKEGSRMNYKGEIGYYPLFIFWAEEKELVATHLVRGNARATPKALRLVKQALQSVGTDRRLFLRADSEFYSWILIEFCEQRKITYAITAGQTANLKKAVESLPDSQWRYYQSGMQIAQFQYAPDRHGPHRYLATRQSVIDEQGNAKWKYHVVITNDKRRAGKVMKWSSGRCAMENFLKEHKRDFGFEKMPSKKFNANWTWLLISQLAWNIVAWFNRLCLPTECHKITVATLRHRLFKVAARIVHQSRQRYLVLSEKNHFKDWWLFAINRLNKFNPISP